MSTSVKIGVGPLLNKPQGARIDFDLEEELSLGEHVGEHLVAPVTAEITVMKLDNQLVLMVQNLQTMLECNCDRCLAPVQIPVFISATERQFFLGEQDRIEEEESDAGMVDMKDATIDAYPMLREEILLQFPPITLCSESCKGLCERCGKNRNSSNCDCGEQQHQIKSPFSILKNQ